MVDPGSRSAAVALGCVLSFTGCGSGAADPSTGAGSDGAGAGATSGSGASGSGGGPPVSSSSGGGGGGGADRCPKQPEWLFEERFTDAQISAKDEVYGESGNAMTLHVPEIEAGGCDARPILFMMHGGGWVSGQKEWLDARARFHARHGIVVATVDYRKTSVESLCAEPERAFYRAAQDLHAAAQYVASRAPELGVDPSLVLLYGNSAGALTSLGLALASPVEIAATYPGVVAREGELDAVSAHPGASYEIAAVFAQAGALFDGAWLEKDPSRPTPALYFAHSENDASVPFGVGTSAVCPGTSFLWYGSGFMRDEAEQNPDVDACIALSKVEGAEHDLDAVYGAPCNAVTPPCAPSRLDETSVRFFSLATAGVCERQSWSCTSTECALDAGAPTYPIGLH
jgi:acetyl esterase/lipase